MEDTPFSQIVGPTYTLSSVNAECQRCLNLFVEKIESGEGDNEFYLKETPGLVAFFDESITPLPAAVSPDVDNPLILATVQAMHKCANGRVFFVMRNILYEITATGVVTYRGNCATESQSFTWRMVDNVKGLFILLDWGPFLLQSGNNKQQFGLCSYDFATNDFHNLSYSRTGFLGTKFIGFMDQYLITVVMSNATNQLTTQFQISPINVGTNQNWNPGAVFSVESSPDNINGMIINGRELWFFGPESYEVFFNSGDAVNPFQRIRDAAYPIGLMAPDSIQAFQGRVFWLGSSKEGFGIVWMSEGYQAKKISTTAIEKLIQGFTTISDAVSWTYQNAGHAVYVLSFPSESVSYGYDLQTGVWHELAYRDPVTGALGRHRGQNQMFAFNKNLVGDYAKGIIHELSSTVYTDNGAPIIRYRRAPVLSADLKKVFFSRLKLDIETGVGLNEDGTGRDPHVSIRWSNDSAHTWSNYHTRSLGKMGEYRTRVILNRLGSGRKRVFEVYFDAPVPFRLISATVRIGIEVE